jgi:hypothetical protein
VQSNRDYIGLFQALKYPFKNEPLRVIESKFVPANECTLDTAKAMLRERFESSEYMREYGVLWPDAVRFLDEHGEERVRYTLWSHLRETTSGDMTSGGLGPTL